MQAEHQSKQSRFYLSHLYSEVWQLWVIMYPITDAQHIFHKSCSCETQLILTVEDLAGEIDNSGQTDIILLDFSKALDMVVARQT